ncbi:ATPase, partial [Bacillus paramycoides]|nr:ATPase [Bacillus paramycoides]
MVLTTPLNTGTKVNVEIHLNNNHDMMKRSLYYWGRGVTVEI